jgi:uncharacterized coiled-coil protein SlyX
MRIKELKRQWDSHYQSEISKKEERLEKLKHVVLEQKDQIKDMQVKLETIDEKHKKEYENEIRKLKKYMKDWKQ